MHPLTVTCAEINSCPNKTSVLSAGFTNIVQLLFTLIGALSVIFILIGALLIILSRGDPGRYKLGRDTVTYAIVGLVVALVSYGVVSFIAGRF